MFQSCIVSKLDNHATVPSQFDLKIKLLQDELDRLEKYSTRVSTCPSPFQSQNLQNSQFVWCVQFADYWFNTFLVHPWYWYDFQCLIYLSNVKMKHDDIKILFPEQFCTLFIYLFIVSSCILKKNESHHFNYFIIWV